MSLWRFRDFEVEVDLMDADFYDVLYEAQSQLDKDYRSVPKTGKISDIIRAQVRCFSNFFDAIFGPGSGEQISDGRNSLEPFLEASDSLEKFVANETGRNDKKYKQYTPQAGNRQQRRQYAKNQNYNRGQNKGGRY